MTTAAARRERSTAVQSSLFVSALLHIGLLLIFWLAQRHLASTPPTVMEVYTVSEQELAALEAQPSAYATGTSLPNSDVDLTPEEIAALPRDPEKLPEHRPSPRARSTLTGQLVELADPLHPQVAPEDAEYMSRADHRVEEETVSRRYKVNSDVLGPTYTDKTSLAHGEEGDAKARLAGDSALERGTAGSPEGTRMASLPRKATTRAARAPLPPPGASPKTTGAEEADSIPEASSENTGTEAQPGVEASFSRSAAVALLDPRSLLARPHRELKSPGERTQDGADTGVARPIDLFPDSVRFGEGGGGGDDGSSPVQLQQGTFAGAPTNDFIREKPGDATMLNAKEFRYFGYIQKIKRQVNFYWTQALDNIGPIRERLTRTEYTTVVHVVLDRNGNLASISLVRTCGVRAFDEATLDAFRIAAPFPPPPPGLLDSSGQAVLPSVGFTVTLSRGAARYSAVDPRANVMFPGIAWPR